VAGMGKGACDRMNGLLNTIIKKFRMRGTKEPYAEQSTAKELSIATNGTQRAGQVAYAVELEDVSRMPETKNPDGISCFHDKWCADDGSVLAVHHTYIGTGVTLIPVAEEDLSWLKEAIAHETDAEEPVLVPLAKQTDRQIKKRDAEQRAAQKKDKNEARLSNQTPSAAQRQVGRAKLAEDMQTSILAAVHICGKCNQVYDKGRLNWFRAHVETCTGPVEKVNVKMQAQSLIGVISTGHTEYAEKHDNTVTFIAETCAQLEAELELQLVNRCDLTAVRVLPTCTRAHVHAIAAPQSVLIAVMHVPAAPESDSITPASAGPAQELSPAEALRGVCFPAKLTLKLPPPPLRARGWAAMIPHREAFKPSQEVEDFLFTAWSKYHKVTANLLAKRLQHEFPNRQEMHHLAVDIDKTLMKSWRQEKNRTANNTQE